MSRRILVDGVEGAGLPPDDEGLLLGLTVFETLRTYGNTFFRLERHLDRLAQSAAALDIALPDRADIRSEMEAVRGYDVRIRYTVTAGGRRIVDVAPVDVTRIGRPMRLATMRWEPSEWLSGAVKHGSRAAWIVAASRLGVDEVMLVDTAGYILEANRSNIFAVVDSTIRTPPTDGRLLSGVTRGALLDAARSTGLPFDTSPLPASAPFDELYVSSTLKGLAPIVELDGQPAAGAGPIGAQLGEALKDLIATEVALS